MTDEASELAWEEAATLKRMIAILESGGGLSAPVCVRDEKSGKLVPLTWIDRITVLAYEAVGDSMDAYVVDLSSKTEEEIAAFCRRRIDQDVRKN